VWGNNNFGQCDVPFDLRGKNVVAVSCGLRHIAAQVDDGRVICWGAGEDCRCHVPPDLEPVIAVNCGGAHSAAVTHMGTLVCWGCNNSGQCDVPPDTVVAVSLMILM
jgi:alpha-tubulin suppressor-like RCC1 family protein